MKLETKRLILRPFKKSDIKDVSNILNNINVTKWMLVFPCPFRPRDAKKLVSRAIAGWKEKPVTGYRFGIERKEDGALIGGMNLSHVNHEQGLGMVSYWIGEKYWKMGYGTESLGAILKFAFNSLKLRRIEAGVYPGNPSSGKLLERFGAKKEGIARKSHVCKADGKIKDTISYGILREEWKK